MLFSSLFLLLIIPFQFNPLISVADIDYKEGNYFEAVTEYKRYIHFSNTQNILLGDAYYKLGLALRYDGDLNGSLDAFQKSLAWDSMFWNRDQIRLSIAINYSGLAKYSLANLILLKIELFGESIELKKNAIFLRAINALSMKDWIQADDALQSYLDLSGTDNPELEKLVNLYLKKKNSLKLKSVKLAKTLSIVLPGSGQIYANDIEGGIGALILNGIFGYIFISDIVQGDYLNALLYSFFIFKRFYSGNLKNAKKMCIAYNESQLTDLAQNFIGALINEFEKK